MFIYRTRCTVYRTTSLFHPTFSWSEWKPNRQILPDVRAFNCQALSTTLDLQTGKVTVGQTARRGGRERVRACGNGCARKRWNTGTLSYLSAVRSPLQGTNSQNNVAINKINTAAGRLDDQVVPSSLPAFARKLTLPIDKTSLSLPAAIYIVRLACFNLFPHYCTSSVK